MFFKYSIDFELHYKLNKKNSSKIRTGPASGTLAIRTAHGWRERWSIRHRPWRYASACLMSRHVPHDAVLEGHIACGRQPCALRRADIDRLCRKIEAGDARLIQRRQFARIRQAIAVQILPDFQLRPERVPVRDLAIAIGIQLRKLPITGLPHPAEHFGNIVYTAVAVPVPHQKTVIPRQPAGTLGKEIAVDIEINRAGADFRCFDAIAITSSAYASLTKDSVSRNSFIFRFRTSSMNSSEQKVICFKYLSVQTCRPAMTSRRQTILGRAIRL